MSPRTITHEIVFEQGTGANERTIVFKLSDSHIAASILKYDALLGGWKQGPSDPEGIDLYPGFSGEDKKRLMWRWDASQHGGFIQVGVDTPYRTVKGKTVESYFKSWFSFRGAKRFVSGQFRIAGALGAGKYDYTIGRGVAMCELPGSSNTFQQGEGRWALYRYNFHEDDDEEQ